MMLPRIHLALLLVVGLLINPPLSLVAQHMITFDKQWYVFDDKPFSPDFSTSIYEFRNDTVINQTEYLQLFLNPDSSFHEKWTPTGYFFREDSMSRVYIWDHGVEALLYDFNLNVEDTIQIDIMNRSCVFKVVEIDSFELVNGEKRKRLSLISNTEPDPKEPLYGFKYWVKGIGDLTSLFQFVGSCATDYSYNLLCFFDGGKLLYADPGNSSCFLTSLLPIEPKPTIKIYPNPVSDRLFINGIQGNIQCTIYNVNGVAVLHSNGRVIDIQSLKSGIYFIRIQSGTKLWNRKVLIRNRSK